MIRIFIATALAVAGLSISAPSASAADISVSAEDYTVAQEQVNEYQTCVTHTFDMVAAYAEDEDPVAVSVVITDPEGTEVHRLRVGMAITQTANQMTFCRGEVLSGTYTITATILGETSSSSEVEARVNARAAVDTFNITVPQILPENTVHDDAPQYPGKVKLQKTRTGFKAKFIGGDVTTVFTVKVDGEYKGKVTVHPGQTKIKKYKGERKIRVKRTTP